MVFKEFRYSWQRNHIFNAISKNKAKFLFYFFIEQASGIGKFGNNPKQMRVSYFFNKKFLGYENML